MLPKFLTKLLKAVVQFLFVVKSVLLLAPLSLVRLLRRVAVGGGTHVNPLKNVHPHVFKSESKLCFYFSGYCAGSWLQNC